MSDRRDDESQADDLGTLFPDSEPHESRGPHEARGPHGTQRPLGTEGTREPHEPARPAPRLRLTRRAWIAIGVVGAFVLAAIVTAIVVTAVNSAGAPSKLEAAVTDCGLEGNPYASVADDGRSVTLDTTGDTTVQGLDAADLVCVLVAVDVSDEALEAMSSTTVEDGPQTAEWNGISAAWEHRADAGLDVTLTLE